MSLDALKDTYANQADNQLKKESDKEIALHDEQLLFQGFFRFKSLTLSHSLYAGGHSETMQREVFERGDAAVLLLYDLKAEVVVLVEQFRAGAAKHALKSKNLSSAWLLEPVAGMIDNGESAVEAAIREGYEETGVTVDKLEYIAKYYPSPGACDERLWLFAAEIDSNQVLSHAGNAHEHEDIRVVIMPFTEAKQRLQHAEFTVASTFLSLQWLFYQKLNTSPS